MPRVWHRGVSHSCTTSSVGPPSHATATRLCRFECSRARRILAFLPRLQVERVPCFCVHDLRADIVIGPPRLVAVESPSSAGTGRARPHCLRLLFLACSRHSWLRHGSQEATRTTAA